MIAYLGKHLHSIEINILTQKGQRYLRCPFCVNMPVN